MPRTVTDARLDSRAARGKARGWTEAALADADPGAASSGLQKEV
jgi:hypothetical protein